MAEHNLMRTAFVDMIVRDSIRVIAKGPQALENLYSGYKVLIENLIAGSPEKGREVLKVVARSYKIFSDPEMVEIILKNNVTAKQFILKYGEKITGEDKRKYDMSDRFNSNLISSQDRESQERIVYEETVGKGYAYLDETGKKVTIRKLGTLLFRHWNGLDDEITKYKITRQLDGDNCQIDEIFSNIEMTLMDDPQYKEAVLEELLSKKNMQLSNTGGYIGEIENVTIQDKDFREGSEKVVEGNYYYRVNKDYMLGYHSETITAVMLQDRADKAKDLEDNGESR